MTLTAYHRINRGDVQLAQKKFYGSAKTMTSRDAVQDTFCLLTGVKRLEQLEAAHLETREIIPHQRPRRQWTALSLLATAFILIMVF
jgi:hypothetical protein